MKKNIISFFLASICLSTLAQMPKYRVLSIPVEKYSKNLRTPWAGGLNAPQFSPINLNNDSYLDLFIFDRIGDKVLTFINNGSNTDTCFTYAPQYEALFPAELWSYAFIRDYNNDGIPDIFTHVNTGSSVYKGSYQSGLLHFDLVNPLLQFSQPPNSINIYSNVYDVPVFADVNFDGDMDVLTYGPFGAAIEYYENQSMEHLGDIHFDMDSFQYLSYSICWGSFTEGPFNHVNLNASCKTDERSVETKWESESRDSRDGYHAIYAFDKDGDKDLDLLLSSSNYSNLFLLDNCGDSSFAHMCSYDSLFPACDKPIDFKFGPAAYEVDANNDGLKDLLISTTAAIGSQDIRNVMYYKNTGNPLCPFEFQSDSFMIGEMLNFGTDSKPVFFDINGDGLRDIIVGNYGYFRPFQTYKSSLAYLENIGTKTNPGFKLQNDDYFGLSSYNLVAIHPAFGDLDGDGKEDLLVGEQTGYLHFFKNMGTTVAFFPSMTIPRFDTLDVGQYSSPFIYDLNRDGLNDLVVGKRDGKLSYFWNFGTPTTPKFSMDSTNSSLGNIKVNYPGYPDGYSQPYIHKDSAGNLLLYVGSSRGRIYQFLIDTAKLLGGSFNLIDSNFLQGYPGSNATIAIGDINDDKNLEYLIGNSRGGLMFYSDSIWDPGTVLSALNREPKLPRLDIYPNPAKDYFVCQSSEISAVSSIAIYSILGEKMNTDFSLKGNQLTIQAGNLSNGLYVVKITSTNKVVSGKILIAR